MVAIRKIAAIGILLGLASGQVQAQQKPAGLPDNYPAKPIRVVLSSQPGGGVDIIGRVVMPRLGERWGHTVVIENHGSGVGGLLALDLVVKSPPDGYTLLLCAGSTMLNAALVARVPYDVQKALLPVAQLASTPFVIAVTPSLPVANMRELIAYAKSKPGELNFASSGTGSAAHLGGEMINYLAGVKMVHIPYKGIGPGIIDAMSGRIQLLFGTPLSVMPPAKSGKLKAIAVSTLKRVRALPDIPAVAEDIADFELVSWFGVLAPAGTHAAIVAALNRDINQVLNLPDVQQKLSGDGSEVTPGTSEQFRQSLARGLNSAEKLVKSTGLKLD